MKVGLRASEGSAAEASPQVDRSWLCLIEHGGRSRFRSCSARPAKEATCTPPWPWICLTSDRQAAAWRERIRYRPAEWAHGPNLVEHTPDGEAWRGFAAARELDTIAPGIVLISLPGHTRGHACVAVDAGTHWILHAGDSFYHHGTLDGHSPVPRALRIMETLVAYDLKKVRDNHARLAELYRRADTDLAIVNAHDPVLYERMRAGT
ncbi:hypothetical protein ACFXDH_00685 [Streptomyces sp. NPDC059467]|uniref:hypothetical protein n=1 Tax=Streptomyces sp. NPDC059467 TaxID=3346844 RepID=UPI0036B51843